MSSNKPGGHTPSGMRARGHARRTPSGPAVAGQRGHLSLRRARVVEGSGGSSSHAAVSGAAEAGAEGSGLALKPFPSRPSRPRPVSEVDVTRARLIGLGLRLRAEGLG